MVRPRVESADKVRQVAVQRALDRVYAQWKGDSDDCWMEYFDYTIHHDANDILDITFRASGLGAYPWTNTAHITLDLKTGRPLDPKRAFDPKRLRALARLVDKKVQAAVKAGPAHGVDCCDGDRWTPRPDDVPSFRSNALGDFMLTSRGLVFFYDFGIPHVIQVLTPKSEYLMTSRELAPYILREGPLGWLEEAK